ncbi:YbaK/EbsC family protein [Plantibacter sp. RU18]|uniref:YbaK/EbsC family protein n=1 Tax=Plantibacter sp. RU18 TaxID=3158143 RepID=UPI003D36F033
MTARTHPAVTIVETVLRDYGVAGEVTWLDGAATTAALAAEALGIEVGAIANSLVFTLDGEPTLIMTSGAHRVDTTWVGEQLGGRLKRADAEMVKAATGQVIGGVAPVGHPAPIRTYVDAALAAYPEVWAAAGHAHTVFPVTFEELVRMTGGQVIVVEPAEASA